MGFSKKQQKESDVQVTFYDVAKRSTGTGKASAISARASTKETVNLCIRERKGMSFEFFFLALAILLIVLLIVEFFGVYRPYLALEQLEKQLDDDRRTVQQVYDGMKDRDTVRENYRKYNYENFPSHIIDREDVLDLIESVIFSRGIINTFSLSENTLTLSLSGVSSEDLVAIPTEIGASKIVDTYEMPQYDMTFDETTGTASFSLTVRFKNATEVK